MNSPQRTIHPYVAFTIDIKNSYTYQDFLRRKPKKVQQFKFSIPQNQFGFTTTNEKKVHLMLLKILKIVKPAIKIDLKDFIITGCSFWKAGFLSTLKKISHVKTLLTTMMKPEAKSVKKYLKYFSKLEFLNCQLNEPSTLFNLSSYLSKNSPENYLKYLKYCPKIDSLKIQDFSTSSNPLKTGFESRRYLRSLGSLALRNKQWNGTEPSFPIELCENLKSVSIRLFDTFSCQASFRTLFALPKLSHLKEISLSFGFSQTFHLIGVLHKIAKRGILEKISLELGDGMQNFYKIFEALKLCKLTHFSLRTEVQTELFKFISGFIESMSSLESFNLDISNSYSSPNDNEYIEMCKQINKLPKLKILKLNLDRNQEIFKSPRIQCFIPCLSDMFKKPIKIQKFHLVCKKLPASESLQSLTSIFKNSAAFLTHLKIDFGTLPYTKKTYRSILSLLKNSSKIQVLEIPCLAVNGATSQFLIEIAKTLHECIYLREFKIGEIFETAVVPDILSALEIILSKRGLRQFSCFISEGFRKNVSKEAHIQFPNLKRIIERNPQLDTMSLADDFKGLINSNR